MPYLQKTWIRIFISLLFSSVVLNLLAVFNADPVQHTVQRPKAMAILIVAAVCYLFLTAYVKSKARNDRG